MANLVDLLIGLGIDATDYVSGIDAASQKSTSFIDTVTGGLTPAIVGAFATGSAAVGGFALYSVDQFADFQSHMNEVFTLLPSISQSAMTDMTDQVKQFATDFGVLPDDVVPALYQSLSAGVPADNVFNFLEDTNEAATAGVTDLETAVDGISSVVNAYGSTVIDAGQASDMMFTAVKLGKTTFAELSSSIFNVTPAAAAAGVAFGDVSAALAAMTLQGVPTNVATTKLRSVLNELSQSGTDVDKIFRQVAGTGFKDFIAGGGNLQNALQLLEQHAHTTGVGINDLFSSVEAGSGALLLTGTGTDAFSTALDGMQNSAGATDAAFATMNTGITDSIDDIKAGFAVFVLEVGERLAPFAQIVADTLGEALPVLADIILGVIDPITTFANTILTAEDPILAITQAVSTFSPVLGALIGYFLAVVTGGADAKAFFDSLPAPLQTIISIVTQVSNVIGANLQPILLAVATVLAVVVVGAIASFIATVATIAAPILATVAIVAAMYAAYQSNFLGVQTLVTTVINAVSGVITVVMGTVSAFWQQNGADILAFTSSAWRQIQSIIGGIVEILQIVIGGALNAVSRFWSAHSTEILAIATGLWNFVKGIFQAGMSIIQGIVNVVLGILKGDWAQFDTGVQQIVGGLLDALETIFSTGLDTVKGVFNLALEGVRSILLGFVGDANSLGGNIINGIIDGVKSGVGALVSAVQNAAASALEAARDFLGIHSPSTKTYWLGQMFMQGPINAIYDMLPSLVRASSAVGEALLSGAQVSPVFSGSTVGGALNGGGVTQNYQIDAHYTRYENELTLRDTIRRESILNAPAGIG